MKKIILTLLLAGIFSFASKAQYSCATASSVTSGSTTYTVSLDSTEWFGWYNTANVVSLGFFYDTTSNYIINKVEIYQGTCAALTLVATDSLARLNSADSAIYFDLSGLDSNTHFYFKVFSTAPTSGTPINGKIITYNYSSAVTCPSGSGPSPLTCDIACNGSLETGACPTGASQIGNATCWASNGLMSNGNTPDYWALCQPLALPAGNTCPFAGSRMGGIYAFTPSLNAAREYAYNTLSSAMVSGRRYYVKFYTSPHINKRYYIDAIGAIITTAVPVTNKYYPATPAISNPSGSIITGTCNPNVASPWTKINGCYIASGGEQYVTIGNFLPNTSVTSTSITCAGPSADAYYFFDKLSVEEIDFTAGTNQTINCGQCVTIGQGTCTDPDITFSWSPTTGITGSTTTYSTTACPTVTTTYTLTVTIPASSGAGCSYTSAVTITVNQPTVTISSNPNPAQICLGQTSATLTASGATTYTWSPSTGLSCTTCSATVATPTANTTYTVIGSLGTCTSSAVITVTVNPLPNVSATSATICPGSTAVLTASGASTYTWSANAGSATTSTVAVSPIVTTVYTVTGTSSVGCVKSATTAVTVHPYPTVPVFTGTLCASVTGTLSVSSGAGYTYVWTPSTGTNSVSCATCQTVTVNNPGGTYTVVATNTVTGCTASNTYATNALPTVNISSSPTYSYCAYSPTTVTLTASGASTYSWSTGATTSTITATPTVTTVFTATGTATSGCKNTGTTTITVVPTPTIAPTVTPNPVCQLQTATLSANGNATTYTWMPGSLTGSVVTVNPNSQTTYTVTGSVSTCTVSGTITLSVTPMPTITITPTGQSSCNYTAPGSATICPGGTATLTATSGGALTSYTWTPGPLTGTAVAVSPTVTTTYTVNGTGSGCPGTKTITITVSTCTCTGTALPALTNTTIATGGPYVVNGNMTVTGNVNLIGIDVKIAPTLSITVPNGAYLRIQGSHLSSCNSMWQGIDVQPGGKLTIESNSLIEDAIAAADDNPTFALHTAASASITVNGAVFNCNRTAIRRANYRSTTSTNYTTSQFRVNDAVITCRCNLPWPITTSTLTVYSNTVTGTPNPSAPDLSDFYSVATYTTASLKPPYFGAAAYDGVRLENVGVNTASVVPLTYVTEVGGANLVLFDNLIYGINVTNTTFSVTNTAYQEPRAISSGGKNPTFTGGYGINAIKTEPDWYPGIDVKSSRFIHMVRGIHNIDYFNIDAETNKLFSRIAIVPVGQVVVGVPAYGSYGMYFSTARFGTANIRTNDFANLTNGVVYSISTATYIAGNGQHVGPITIDQNTLKDQFTGNSYTSKYIGTAISVSNVLTPVAGSTVTPATGTATPVYVGNNTISGAFNGIYQSNHQWQRPRTEINTITLQYQPTILQYESIQYGIQHANCIFQNNFGDAIFDNVVTGYFASTYTFSSSNQALFEKKKGIWSRFSGNHYVTCNDVYHSGRGFEFEGDHTVTGPTYWAKNTMNHCGEAYAITNNGTIGIQRTGTVTANDNQWLSTANTYADTYTDANSAPSGSILWLQASILPLGPITNTTSSGTPYSYMPAYLVQPKPVSTYSCTQSPPTSRVSNTSNGNLTNRSSQNGLSEDSLYIHNLEAIAQDSVDYPTYFAQNSYISKNALYRALRRNDSLISASAILANFYNSNASSSWALFSNVEDSLFAGNYAYASLLINGYASTCSIEENYKRFYSIYSNTMQGLSSPSDSADLAGLASSCPMLNGTVVFQARALRNSIMGGFENYEDNCPQDAERFAQVKACRENSLLVYPNPTNGKVYISGFAVSDKLNAIDVMDVTGKLVFKQQVQATNGMIELNLNLNSGVYFIKITADGKANKIEKVIINR